MPIDGQAESAPSAEDDLVSFLVDNEDADTPQDPPTNGDEPGDEPDNSDTGNQEDDPAEGDDPEGDEPDADDPDEEAKPKVGLKFKVPVKGEDGAETTIEVDEKELIAGYQRHSDYTKKMQGIARERDEVHTVVRQEIDQGRRFFMSQAQMAQDVVRQIAGLRSPQEMAVLAQSDPGLWVQENAREQQIKGLMQTVSHAVEQQQLQAQQEQQTHVAQQFQHAWGVLGQKGIDKPALKGIYESASKHYGFPMENWKNLYDPSVILMLRDAVAYQDLKAKSAAMPKKAKVAAQAPRLPAARQSVPPTERSNQKLEKKFRNGTAGLNDLARFV